MHIDPIRLGVPFTVLAFPLLYALSLTEDQTPWLLALAVYYFAGFLTMARFEPVAYRTRGIGMWTEFAINLAIAGTLGIGYAVITNVV